MRTQTVSTRLGQTGCISHPTVWLAHHRPGQLFGQVTQFSVVRLVDGLLHGLHTITRKMYIIDFVIQEIKNTSCLPQQHSSFNDWETLLVEFIQGDVCRLRCCNPFCPPTQYSLTVRLIFDEQIPAPLDWALSREIIKLITCSFDLLLVLLFLFLG